MCGIVGGIGNIDFHNYLIEGLKKLDYRGYDSAGLAFMKGGKVELHRAMGKVSDLEAITPKFTGASVGIAHTRWATHGEPSEINAHPQKSNEGIFYIVHNGVIENFRELKSALRQEGYIFYSKTDTEVIANLLESHYKKEKDVLRAIEETQAELQGSYACAIIFALDPEHLYFMKNASPLLIGLDGEANYLASDAVPMIPYCNKFIDVEDGEYGRLTASDFEVYRDGKPQEPHYTERNAALLTHDLGDYPHYMLKEIEETPACIRRLVENYFDGTSFLFDQGMINALKKADYVLFLACGTSSYASEVGVRYMRELGKNSDAVIASEWAYDPFIKARNPVYILLSQSGETADLIHCLKIINERGGTSIAITNSKGSTIERKSTYACLLYAGLEVAVASTKSYADQVVFLALLKAAVEGDTDVIKDIRSAIAAQKTVIKQKEDIHEIAKKVKGISDAFFVGRGFDFLACKEGTLKLKEIAYVHSEAYPGGELKHGPIALIQPGTCVFCSISEERLSSQMRNNLEELKARGADIILFSRKALQKKGDAFSYPDIPEYLSPLLSVLCFQYLSYYVALEKDLPIDKPRNLAKSVTVE